MPGFNNNWNNYGQNNGYSNNNGYGNNYGNNQNNGIFGLTTQQLTQYFQQGKLEWSDYVHGRAGAEAYQLPPGVTMAKLWDDEADRFYVKGYDNNGRPRVLDDNDFTQHIDPEPQPIQNVDMSIYATKDDLKKMLEEAFSNFQVPMPNLAGYATQSDLNKAISNLAVGNGGRIVRIDEQNA